MNNTQKQYELNFRLITNPERFDTTNYYRSLEIIRNRRNQYDTPKHYIIKRMKQEPYKNYYIMDSNRKLKNKLEKIYERPVIPKLNEEFMRLSQKLRIRKEKQRELSNKTKSLDIDSMNRILNSKPLAINIKYLEKINSKTHDKYIEQLKSPVLIKKTKYNYPTYLPSIYKLKNRKYNTNSQTQLSLAIDFDNLFYTSLKSKDYKQKEISYSKKADEETTLNIN